METSPTTPAPVAVEEPIPSKNVEYVLVAEFDIDKGSTITFQYPEPTGEDTQYVSCIIVGSGTFICVFVALRARASFR